MSTHRALPDPPRLGLAILNRLADRNEALAGDLLEGFRLKQSRLWFWRELAGAIVTGGFRRTEIRPIRLVDFPTLAATARGLRGEAAQPSDARTQRQSGRGHRWDQHRHGDSADLPAGARALDRPGVRHDPRHDGRRGPRVPPPQRRRTDDRTHHTGLVLFNPHRPQPSESAEARESAKVGHPTLTDSSGRNQDSSGRARLPWLWRDTRQEAVMRNSLQRHDSFPRMHVRPRSAHRRSSDTRASRRRRRRRDRSPTAVSSSAWT